MTGAWLATMPHDDAMPADERPLLGLDLGGTKILGVLTDGASGGLVREESLPTQRERGAEAVLADCRALLEGLQAGGPRARALGVGFAGLVDSRRGVVSSSVILPGWDGLPLAARLSDDLGLPVTVDNDATAAGWGEFIALERHPEASTAARRRDLLVLTVGTGIGGALFAGGQLQRGAAGLAGEVGHMTIDRHGEVCVCGRRGCLHTLASGTALNAAATRLAEEDPRWLRSAGAESDAGSDPDTHGPHAPPTLEAVGRAAAAGDPRARGLVESGGEALGVGIANLAQLLNPSRVALCGGVTGLGDLWLDAVRAAVERNVFPEVGAAMEIAPALLGARSGAFGAAHLGELRDEARSS